MRRRTSIIWLVLAVLPYLTLTLFGKISHQFVHTAHHPAASLTVAATPGTAEVANADRPEGGDCPICRWHRAATPCVQALLPAQPAPPAALDTPRATRFALVSCFRLPASRAPPASLA